ncbi:unnamed protein product [Cuscuta campestris]|uniref:Berberine/berberine-like domain-containing protein n=1 Tax=Cuscuta campestris TaxID=132261 RepID=A0A484NBC6_9ASTE|nr:unnamed protein product [Cuscuta campestris]
MASSYLFCLSFLLLSYLQWPSCTKASLHVHSATLRTCLARKLKHASEFSKEYFTQGNSSYVPILEELAHNGRFLNTGFPKPWAIITPKDEYEVQARVWGVKYFKNNFDRLVRVKTMVDPQDFFRNEQSIPPLPAATTIQSNNFD